jgi:NAD(P)H-dependent FMN reductase
LINIPQFNPADDNENAPAQVKEFRQQLCASDGIIISTPEYAMGIPGSLKNAIDWTVSSSSFSKKPVLLITAASLGQKAHLALMDVLNVIEADIVEQTAILIPFANAKIDNNNHITHSATEQTIIKAVQFFQNKL